MPQTNAPGNRQSSPEAESERLALIASLQAAGTIDQLAADSFAACGTPCRAIKVFARLLGSPLALAAK